MVEPHYPKGEGGRPPIGLERMMRMLFVQHWFNEFYMSRGLLLVQVRP